MADEKLRKEIETARRWGGTRPYEDELKLLDRNLRKFTGADSLAKRKAYLGERYRQVKPEGSALDRLNRRYPDRRDAILKKIGEITRKIEEALKAQKVQKVPK